MYVFFFFIVIILPIIFTVIWAVFRNAVIDAETIPQAECVKQDVPARRGMKTYGVRTDGGKKLDAYSRRDTDNVQDALECVADLQTADPKDIVFDRRAEQLKRGITLQKASNRITPARERQAGYGGGPDF